MSSGWICFGDVPSINKLAGAARTSEALAECKAEAEFKSMSSVAAAALELVCRKRLVGSVTTRYFHQLVCGQLGLSTSAAIPRLMMFLSKFFMPQCARRLFHSLAGKAVTEELWVSGDIRRC